MAAECRIKCITHTTPMNLTCSSCKYTLQTWHHYIWQCQFVAKNCSKTGNIKHHSYFQWFFFFFFWTFRFLLNIFSQYSWNFNWILLFPLIVWSFHDPILISVNKNFPNLTDCSFVFCKHCSCSPYVYMTELDLLIPR